VDGRQSRHRQYVLQHDGEDGDSVRRLVDDDAINRPVQVELS